MTETLTALAKASYAAHTAARELFEKQVGEIADRFRVEVLIPFCTKRKLEFISGNGLFFLSKPGSDYDDERWMSPEGATDPEMEIVLQLLNEESFGRFEFGLHVQDVRKNDWLKKPPVQSPYNNEEFFCPPCKGLSKPVFRAGKWYCRECGRLLVRRAPALVVGKRV